MVKIVRKTDGSSSPMEWNLDSPIKIVIMIERCFAQILGMKRNILIELYRKWVIL